MIQASQKMKHGKLMWESRSYKSLFILCVLSPGYILPWQRVITNFDPFCTIYLFIASSRKPFVISKIIKTVISCHVSVVFINCCILLGNQKEEGEEREDLIIQILYLNRKRGSMNFHHRWRQPLCCHLHALHPINALMGNEDEGST